MDDYLFRFNIEKCRYINEETRCLEMFNYSDPLYDTVVEQSLPLNQFTDFLSQKGAFEQPKIPDGMTQLAGFRMILQQNVLHPEVFDPSVISLPPDIYSKMMTELHLPYKGIEGSSTVGPFFWSAIDDDDKHIFQIIYRKSDVTKKVHTRAWELLLSFNVLTGITTAFCKASPKSHIIDSIKHLKASSQQIGHPILFPIIIFSHYYSARLEVQQRDARLGLRKIEMALNFIPDKYESELVVGGMVVENSDDYFDENKIIDFDRINRDLVETHTKTLSHSPAAYLRVLDGFKEAMNLFEMQRVAIQCKWPELTHSKFASRIGFYRKKVQGQGYYQSSTLQRLEAQRNALSVSCGQIDNRVSFQIAEAQTKLAYSNKREAVSQKVIAILGTVFLPGAYLSSLFSMTFFDWQSSKSNELYVSPLFWIYWAISIPLTIAVVGTYILWDRRLSIKAHKEDEMIEIRMLDMKRISQNQAVTSRSVVNGCIQRA